MTVQEIHERTGKLIAEGWGDLDVIDIDNRTESTDYVISEMFYAPKIGVVVLEYDEIDREANNG
jgi:hypothetical protein